MKEGKLTKPRKKTTRENVMLKVARYVQIFSVSSRLKIQIAHGPAFHSYKNPFCDHY